MAKPKLGIKRACLECGTRYFDLNRNPIACPKCGANFDVVTRDKTRPANAEPEKAVAEDVAPEPSAVAKPAAEDGTANDDTDGATDGDGDGDGDGEAEIISLDEAEKADGDDDIDDDEAVAVLPDDKMIIDDDGDDEVFVKDDDDEVSDIAAGGDGDDNI